MQEIRDIYNQIKGKILKRLAEFKFIWKHASEEDIFAELVFCLLTPQSKARSCWAAVERLKTAGTCHGMSAKQIEKCLTGVRFHHNKARYIIEAMEKFTINNKINIKQKLLEIISWGCVKSRPSPVGSDIARVGLRVRHRKICGANFAVSDPTGAGQLLQCLTLKTAFYTAPAGVRGKFVCSAREWLVENIKGLGYKEASHFLRNVGFGKDIAILDRHILKNLKKFGVIKEIPKTITAKNYCALEEKMRQFAKKIKIPLDHLDFIFWYKEAGDVFK